MNYDQIIERTLTRQDGSGGPYSIYIYTYVFLSKTCMHDILFLYRSFNTTRKESIPLRHDFCACHLIKPIASLHKKEKIMNARIILNMYNFTQLFAIWTWPHLMKV